MQALRLYFPLFQATQLIGGVSSAYSQEIKKLRKFGLNHLLPRLCRSKFRNYPFRISLTFFTYSSFDIVSASITSAFIIHLFESTGTIQSCDYRVIPNIEVKIKKILNQSDEGCELTIESIKD